MFRDTVERVVQWREELRRVQNIQVLVLINSVE